MRVRLLIEIEIDRNAWVERYGPRDLSDAEIAFDVREAATDAIIGSRRATMWHLPVPPLVSVLPDS